MKHPLKKILFVTLLFLLLGCRKEEEKIDNVLFINPHKADPSIPLSALVESVSYIRLETNEHSMMVNIREIIIKDRYIYAVDRNLKAVFVFDKKGNFVSKLNKHGSGPDEYGTMDQVLVDDEEEYIEVFDYRGEKSRIIKYENVTFDYLDEKEIFLPNANTMRKEKDADIYYFSAQQLENTIGSEISNADIIAVKGDQTQKALFKKKIITEGNTFSPNTESFTTNDEGEIFVSLMFNNSFYQLSDMEAYLVLAVDFGKYGIDHSIGLKSTKEQSEYLFSEKSDGLASFPVLNINNSKLLAFSYYFKENSKTQLHHYIHFKNNNRIFHVRDIQNDMTGFPEKVYLSSYFFAVNHEVFHDGHLVDIILPWYHNKDKEVEIPGVGIVHPEDNPVILMMKLKKEFVNN